MVKLMSSLLHRYYSTTPSQVISSFVPISYIYSTFSYFLLTADFAQVGPRSLYFDVTGDARREKVKLPSCIRSSKPGALPNTQVCATPLSPSPTSQYHPSFPISHFPTPKCVPALVPDPPLPNTQVFTTPRSPFHTF